MISLKEILDSLKYNCPYSTPGQFTIIGIRKDEEYILSVKEGFNFEYGFKPINSIAYYEYGWGTCFEIEQYFKRLKKYEFKFYAFPSLKNYFECKNRKNYEIIIPDVVEITIKVNGELINKPLNIETAKRLGIVK